MLQHHGDSRTAVPHPIVRARQKGAFPTESVLLQGGGKAAQNPLCWCKTQDKDYHSSARGPINFGKKAASCYCKARRTCRTNLQARRTEPQSKPATHCSAKCPWWKDNSPQKGSEWKDRVSKPTNATPQQKLLFQVMCPVLLPQDQTSSPSHHTPFPLSLAVEPTESNIQPYLGKVLHTLPPQTGLIPIALSPEG